MSLPDCEAQAFLASASHCPLIIPHAICLLVSDAMGPNPQHPSPLALAVENQSFLVLRRWRPQAQQAALYPSLMTPGLIHTYLPPPSSLIRLKIFTCFTRGQASVHPSHASNLSQLSTTLHTYYQRQAGQRPCNRKFGKGIRFRGKVF